jgi:hypothetical protein
VNSFVTSSTSLGLFPVQLTWFASIAFNTEEAAVKYLAKDIEAANIAPLDKS